MRHKIGQTIKDLRLARGITLEDLAADLRDRTPTLNWDAGNLSRCEKGDQEYSEARFIALANYFNLRPSEIYRMAEEDVVGTDPDPSITTRIISTAVALKPDQQGELLRFAQFLASK